MKIDIIEVIHKKCLETGLPVVGVASSPFRLDFSEDATQQQKDQALVLANNILENKTEELAVYIEQMPIFISPEKVSSLADLLVQKGLLSKEEIQSLY